MLIKNRLLNSAFHLSTLKEVVHAEFQDKGSRFLAIAFPIKTTVDFKQQLLQIKALHPKAGHHCFAYRLGNDQYNFRSSDDGEPSGTAGKPILNQIDSHQVSNTGVIVSRYFGGILLGIPGLINAYKTSAALALDKGQIIQVALEKTVYLSCDYVALGEVMTLLKKNQLTLVNKNIELFSTLEISIPLEHFESIYSKLLTIRSVQEMDISRASN